MKKGLAIIGGIGVGAGLMYLFDPDRGHRRQAQLRDKVNHGLHKTSDAIEKTARDVSNRAHGAVAELESLFASHDKSDVVVAARVRSKLGRLVSNPKAVTVTVTQGKVTLSGNILSDEVNKMLKAISAITGVEQIVNELKPHEQANNVPDLQGRRLRRRSRLEFMKTNWSPGTRLMAVAAGCALSAYGRKRNGILWTLSQTFGVGLLSRGLTNMEIGRFFGVSKKHLTVDIQKTINIAAPMEDVFDLWLHHENFPNFMSNVREVKSIGENRYHWVVAGPAGIPIEWDGEITRIAPNELIEFKSLPESVIEQRGVIQFKALDEGDTCVDIKMSYTPPAGMAGHTVAKLLGFDPKSQMDEDLMRMKSLIETGRIPNDAAKRQVAANKQ